MKQGTKEEINKLSYELDFDFIEQLAERMAENIQRTLKTNKESLLKIEN